jgi:hypothetical protein
MKGANDDIMEVLMKALIRKNFGLNNSKMKMLKTKMANLV